MKWLSFSVSDEMINKAMRIRAERDEKYGNIYQEVDTDLRWVGDLGEICINNWLRSSGHTDFLWHLDNVAGKPDFTIKGKRVDIKTVKRKVAPMADYTAQITASHKDSPVDELFFCSYEFQVKRMWFLGGISKKEFLTKATFYQAGDMVHTKYIIRQGHEIYNAPISFLKDPDIWLAGFNS